jgi:hypothetical protein
MGAHTGGHPTHVFALKPKNLLRDMVREWC